MSDLMASVVEQAEGAGVAAAAAAEGGDTDEAGAEAPAGGGGVEGRGAEGDDRAAARGGGEHDDDTVPSPTPRVAAATTAAAASAGRMAAGALRMISRGFSGRGRGGGGGGGDDGGRAATPDLTEEQRSLAARTPYPLTETGRLAQVGAAGLARSSVPNPAVSESAPQAAVAAAAAGAGEGATPEPTAAAADGLPDYVLGVGGAKPSDEDAYEFLRGNTGLVSVFGRDRAEEIKRALGLRTAKVPAGGLYIKKT